MKKISIISLHLGYGGAEQAVTSLANMLSNNYDVEIISIYKLYKEPSFKVDKRVKINYLIDSNLPLKLSEYKKLLKTKQLIRLIQLINKNYIKQKKIKLFIKEIYLGTKMMLFDRKKVLQKYLQKTNSDVIISSKEMYNKILGNIKNKQIMKIGWEHNHHNNNNKYINKVVKSSKKLDNLILVSNELADFYKKKLEKTNCEVVYISNTLDNIPKIEQNQSSKKLISVGRLSPEKGFIDLLNIMKKLNKEYDDWTLDIIGDGNDYNQLNKFIEVNNLTNVIKLHGFQSKDYINKMLKESSIYLMTSHSESFGIVLIEAMSHKLPCIAYTSARGAIEIIDNNENGFLIDDRNEELYLKKLKYLIKNKNKRIKFGEKGYRDIKKYSQKEVIKDWISLIERNK